MSFPEWAPPRLVGCAEWLEKQSESGPADVLRLTKFLSHGDKVRIVRALTADQRMEKVWKSLFARAKSFQPPPLPNTKVYTDSFRALREFNQSQEGGLFNRCEAILGGWQGLPKWTPAQARKHYGNIAEKCSELVNLLAPIYWQDHEIQHVDDFLEEERFKGLARAFELDDSDFGGREGEASKYVKFWISDALPSFCVLLQRLAEKANDRSMNPPGVSQPNSPKAETHFFVRHLSAYFSERYSTPLHSQNAAITNAIFGISPGSAEEITEDDVRMLVRLTAAPRRKIGED